MGFFLFSLARNTVVDDTSLPQGSTAFMPGGATRGSLIFQRRVSPSTGYQMVKDESHP